MTGRPDLIRLESHPHSLISTESRTVYWCGLDGWITDPQQHGLYVYETRVLSRYRWVVNRQLYVAEASKVRQASHVIYYTAVPRTTRRGFSTPGGARDAQHATEETIELLLGTVVSDGFHQDADLSNFTNEPQDLDVEIEFDADFADQDEVVNGHRQQKGKLDVTTRASASEAAVSWAYVAEHKDRRVERAFTLSFRGDLGKPQISRRSLRLKLRLKPRERRHICIDGAALIDRKRLAPPRLCYSYWQSPDRERRRRQNGYLTGASAVAHQSELSCVYAKAVERACDDLLSLRLFDHDRREHIWVPAAGAPTYIAVFGRDILTAAWQSAITSPEIMYGALEVLRETQGRTDNAWRDEEPGKMLHEAHTGPVGVLNFSPRGAYYGEFTSTPFYIVVLSELYHWTGDKSAMLRHLPVARACMRWIDRYGDLDGDGFYEYRSRSSQGVKNQAWKDSGDAIVDDKGRIVDTPLGTCEQQGFVYEAKLRMAELLWLIGERGEAKRCFHQAQELKKRFNDRFWMKDERFFAMAKDRKGRLVRSISSNPGDALATGIIDAEHAKPTADRLFAPDLFSGWGIRTLSTEHPAYNPYSYHRGSVWPAENAAIAVGLRRYGFTDRLQQLTSALLQVASLFDQQRLPEVFSGHGQNERHPFPAVYPEACAPQAWSASAVLILQQMLLGIYPYAPMNLLFVEPALPEWMPNTPLRNLNVGKHRVSLEFTRSADGHTNYKVLDNPGNVRVIRQPSPWSVYASPLRRIEELIESLAA